MTADDNPDIGTIGEDASLLIVEDDKPFLTSAWRAPWKAAASRSTRPKAWPRR